MPFTSNLELRAKHINYVGNLLLEYAQRCSDVTPVAESYFAGQKEWHFHGRVGVVRLCIAVSCVSFYGEPEIGCMEESMLVWIGQLLKIPGPAATLKRLQSAQDCLVFDIDARQPPVRALIGPCIEKGCLFGGISGEIFNRKLRALLDLSRIEESEFVNKIIKGSPLVIENFTDEDAENWLKRLGERGMNVERIPKIVESGFQLDEVVFCPTYSRIGIVKAWLAALDI